MGLSYEVIKDPIHGYIKVFEHELKIIDTPVFQRLRRLKQNTGADFVYPGATHTRFSHSLGAMHLAGLFTQRILDQIEGIADNTKRRYYFMMRLWGLTHDIGHGPFSHLFDDVVLSKFETDHERIGAEILRESSSLPDKLEIQNVSEIDLGEIANLLEVKTIEDWPLTSVIEGSSINEKIFFYIGHGAYSVDLLDYIPRDSYFTGAGYGNIDYHRLIYASIPHSDRICLDAKAEGAFDSLLISRLSMFSAVYYHRTTRAVARVMQQFLEEADSCLNFEEIVKDLEQYVLLEEDSLLYHPKLADSQLGQCLKKRKIPYGSVREISLGIEDVETSGFLEEEFLTQGTRARLTQKLQKLPQKAFFVDTPKIPANPLLGQDFIYLYDSRRQDPIYPRNVKKASWGTLTKEISIIRLYVHDDYRQHEDDIFKAFSASSSRPRTHT